MSRMSRTPTALPHSSPTGGSTLTASPALSAMAASSRRLAAIADSAGLAVKVLPPVGELCGNAVGVRDIRDINLVDLLGRRPVETDLDSIAGYLTGRRPSR